MRNVSLISNFTVDNYMLKLLGGYKKSHKNEGRFPKMGVVVKSGSVNIYWYVNIFQILKR